jgi:hypothetical protein
MKQNHTKNLINNRTYMAQTYDNLGFGEVELIRVLCSNFKPESLNLRGKLLRRLNSKQKKETNC